MLQGWKIGRVRGVDVRIHVSLLFLLVYIVIAAAAQFPMVARQARVDLSDLAGGPISWGVVFAVALFISVLLHEFGHMFLAQSYGVKVRSITLMMLGGVSEMERIPEARLEEFKVALAGPIVSFAIAGALYLIGHFSTNVDVYLFSFWLSRVNLALGIFNLIPAFPMDGGRALRSMLALRQSPLHATRVAAGVGRFFAVLLGLWGFFQFNILLILISVFLYVGAQSELAILTGREMLRGLTAGEVAVRLPSVEENERLNRAAEIMINARSAVLPVVTRSGEPALISIEGLARVPRDEWGSAVVSSAMQGMARWVSSGEQLADLFIELVQSPLRALPFMEHGKVAGIVRYSDLSDLLRTREMGLSPRNDDRPKKAA